METFLATLSTSRFFLIHITYAYIWSSCIYEDVNYPFEDDLYILKLPLIVFSLVNDSTKVHQFDLVLTDTESIPENRGQLISIFCAGQFQFDAIYSMILDVASWSVN